MKRIAALAISISVLLAQTDRPGLHSVTAVRHWSLPDVTRIAIEVSGDFKFRTDRLHDPERVYFDILNSRPRLENRRIHSESIDDKLLLRVRVAETNPGITRVVFDLAGGVEVSTSQLTNPYRLMIELRRGEAAPATPTSAPAPVSRPSAIDPGGTCDGGQNACSYQGGSPPAVTAEPSKAQIAPAKVGAPSTVEPPPKVESKPKVESTMPPAVTSSTTPSVASVKSQPAPVKVAPPTADVPEKTTPPPAPAETARVDKSKIEAIRQESAPASPWSWGKPRAILAPATPLWYGPSVSRWGGW